MNKKRIKAELRRSACEDVRPASNVGYDAYQSLSKFRDFSSYPYDNPFVLLDGDCRTFFLLVAEAL